MTTAEIAGRFDGDDWAGDQHLADILTEPPRQSLLNRAREWADEQLGTDFVARHRLELATAALGTVALVAEEAGRRWLPRIIHRQ